MDGSKGIAVSLSAVIVSVTDDGLKILMLPGAKGMSLPFGRFSPHNHRTLEEGLKDWVASSTGINLDYVEQVYTFGNLFRSHEFEDRGERLLTISYLALTTYQKIDPKYEARWVDYYRFFPWEDHRSGVPKELKPLLNHLKKWAKGSTERKEKMAFSFGDEKWDPDKALFRYELLYRAGLIKEAVRDYHDWGSEEKNLPIETENIDDTLDSGEMLSYDHRRILASAIGRLRGKLRYRPLVFELLPPEFTLLGIQRVMEALRGEKLHKQNFRRLLLSGGFIQESGALDRQSGGRPASLYRFTRPFRRP